MEFKYRLANKDDINDLVELRMKLMWYNLNRTNGIIEDEQALRNNIYEMLQEELNKTVYFFVAENEERKIIAKAGVIIQKFIPSIGNLSGKEAYITSVYTDEEYRQKGIQRKLVSMVIEFAKENGCENIELNSSNPNAISLYESLGFRRKNSSFALED